MMGTTQVDSALLRIYVNNLFLVSIFRCVGIRSLELALTYVLYYTMVVTGKMRRGNTKYKRSSGPERLPVAMQCAGNCKYDGD